jgi:N-acetylmuramoyl-L-alanine amidase
MQVKKIALDFGHSSLSPVPGDSGAVGIQSEDVCLRQLADILIPELRKYFDVVLCTPQNAKNLNQSLSQRVNIANKSNADLFISFHCNAFSSHQANGTEVFTFSPTSLANNLGRDLVNNISALGFKNRGLKWSRFFVLRMTKMPAVLIESHFVTSPDDCKKYNPLHLSNAIVKSLVPIRNKMEKDIPILVEPVQVKADKTVLLKSSYVQSNRLTEILPAGIYDAKLIGYEEKHYIVKFKEEFLQGEWFIYENDVTVISSR